MAYRIGHLISQRKIPAYSILGLSFTRKAATELKERVSRIVTQASGKSANRGLTITTFHSLCVKILRQGAEKLGFQNNFTIIDQNDQIDILKGILKHIKVDDRKFDPATILFEMGQAKNRFLGPEQAREFFLESGRVASDYAIICATAFEHYQDKLRGLNAMDFDDLLYNCVTLLEKHEDVRAACNERFQFILVDEYQDTNPAQFKLLRLLTEKQQNICVVGDDDQSIYSFRGADATHILEFGRHYPGARTITLDQNYRSTTTILDAANEVIAQNRHRHPKRLWSDKGAGEPILQIIVEEDRAEAKAVAEEILRRAQGVSLTGQAEESQEKLKPWKDFAVLYRSNPQSRLFEEALRMCKIPYKIVGSMSFLDRKEVKDVLSYWRLIVNPKDDPSARRILNWPARGLGKTTLDTVNTYALQQGISFFEALGITPGLSTKAQVATQAFCTTIHQLRAQLQNVVVTSQNLADWGRRSLTALGIKDAIYDDNEDDPLAAQRKWENADEMCNALGQINLAELEESESADDNPYMSSNSLPGAPISALLALREFLGKMTLEPEDDRKDDKKEEKNQVTLLTLHGAKGLEYPVVFLVGVEEGFLPHKRTIEEAADFSEERRLTYVGITRAKEQLIITRAKNRIRYGKPVPRTPSRFLLEIPPNLILTQDESLTPDPTSDEKREEHEVKVKNFLADIRAQLLNPKK